VLRVQRRSGQPRDPAVDPVGVRVVDVGEIERRSIGTLDRLSPGAKTFHRASTIIPIDQRTSKRGRSALASACPLRAKACSGRSRRAKRPHAAPPPPTLNARVASPSRPTSAPKREPAGPIRTPASAAGAYEAPANALTNATSTDNRSERRGGAASDTSDSAGC